MHSLNPQPFILRRRWAGVLPKEPDSRYVEADLQDAGVSTTEVVRLNEGKLPTSYITLSEASGARTIVHVRDCPEYKAEWFNSVEPQQYDWIHFEGRNVEELATMLRNPAAPWDSSWDPSGPARGFNSRREPSTCQRHG